MMKNIAIIGAGVSGLTAAHALKYKAHVKLFDKSRGVGGRMSTRYAGAYEFDHGAQFFTARDSRFQKVVELAIDQGVVAPWHGRAFYKKGTALEVDIGSDRFAAVPRMNSWPKVMAKGLDISLGARVSKLTRDDKQWELHFEDGGIQAGFDHIICAVPSVQAIELLPDNFSGMEALKSVQMDACFALMIGFDQLHDFGWDSLRVNDDVNAWLAVNSSKPERNKDVTTLMIHSAPQWSNLHADADREWVQAQMERSASEICGIDISAAPHRALHRWLYSSVSASPQKGALHAQALGLTACGDWCLGGRVEGAYLSGLAAADALISQC
ncbi:NAD(P)/FAD-dependent oxidoreductase [Hellea balneolensis]|uniref:NAD(P)/FAD-dependent oxidoreductase n=1 Tax=Hellea balneolensis TaxID=287478 RepID=UPI0003FDDC77|nr:FAD-dependent oxidoreductase [Hellea balneolensis]